MLERDTTIQEKTKNFAVRVVFAYTEIVKKSNYDDAARILAKQFLPTPFGLKSGFRSQKSEVIKARSWYKASSFMKKKN